MKTSVWESRIFKTGDGSWSRIPIMSKVAITIFTIAGLLGCSISDILTSIGGSAPTPTSASNALPTDTSVPDSPTIPPPSSTPQPTFTELPTYTPFPTYTLLPTYAPLPTYTPFPSLTAEIIYLTPDVYSTYPSYMTGECCTLRVWNRAKKVYWIGTKMPIGGNYIPPNMYLEFYLHQPTYMWIEYCPMKAYTHQRYDCIKRYIYVYETLKQISIP